MFKKLVLAALAAFSLSVASAAPPVPKALEPRLDPITHSIVVTCHNQLAFVAVVFEDGSVQIYDKQSGVPAETALYTAARAKTVHGYEACATQASVPTYDRSRDV